MPRVPFAIVHIYSSVCGLGLLFHHSTLSFLTIHTTTTSIWTKYLQLRDKMDDTNMYETPEENAKLAEPDPEFAEVCYYANI